MLAMRELFEIQDKFKVDTRECRPPPKLRETMSRDPIIHLRSPARRFWAGASDPVGNQTHPDTGPGVVCAQRSGSIKSAPGSTPRFPHLLCSGMYCRL